MSQELLFSDLYEPPNPNPFLVVLNYSGGRQSHAIARMILRGEIETPERFIVVAADPGNENVETYEFRDRTFAEFNGRGIPAIVAPGQKMLDDLKERKASGKTRLDTSKLWTENGGTLKQLCTREYKIRPMERVVRAYLKHRYNKRAGRFEVECWIGFAADETHRCKPIQDDLHRYQPRYPLIDRRLSKADVEQWYADAGEPMPPPSVCNHCWANGVATLKRIHDTDPEGWEKAVEFDEASRDLSQFGVKQPCYVSKTLVPLRELAERGFKLTGSDAHVLSCDSGHCFI